MRLHRVFISTDFEYTFAHGLQLYITRFSPIFPRKEKKKKRRKIERKRKGKSRFARRPTNQPASQVFAYIHTSSPSAYLFGACGRARSPTYFLSLLLRQEKVRLYALDSTHRRSGSLRSMRGTGTGRHGNGARHAQRNERSASIVRKCVLA